METQYQDSWYPVMTENFNWFHFSQGNSSIKGSNNVIYAQLSVSNFCTYIFLRKFINTLLQIIDERTLYNLNAWF